MAELLRPPHCRLHERCSDATSAKFFQHFHSVNAGDTCAAAKRRLANGFAFVARRKVPDLARLHKGDNAASLVTKPAAFGGQGVKRRWLVRQLNRDGRRLIYRMA